MPDSARAQQAAPPGSSGGDPGALRETLRLASDLAEALVTQANRAKRQYGELAGPSGASTMQSGLIDALVAEAEKVKKDCTALRRGLSEADGGDQKAVRTPATSVDAELAEAPAKAPQGTQDPARMLAIEMVTQGRSREEVAAYLVETFQLDNAAEIVDEVFRTRRR